MDDPTLTYSESPVDNVDLSRAKFPDRANRQAQSR